MEGSQGEAPRAFPGPTLTRLEGTARSVAAFALGFAVLVGLLLPTGWWSEAAPGLRDVLEALPLGEAVATSPLEEGNPALVALVSAAIVLGAIWATSVWRRRSVRSYLWGGNTFVSIFAVGMVRTFAIFGGLTLVPILTVIADGTDLREEPSYTFTGPLWPLLVILGWCAFNFIDLQRVHDREAERGSEPDSLASGFLGELRELFAARSLGPELLKRLALFAASIALAVWVTSESLSNSPGDTSSTGHWWMGLVPWVVVFAVGTWVVRQVERQARRLRDLRREEP